MPVRSQSSAFANPGPDQTSTASARLRPAAASPGSPPSGLDPQQLEDALVDVLLATARRHGLEV